MKDTLKWIAGGVAAIVVALAIVLGLGYVLGIDAESRALAPARQPDPAPMPSVLDDGAMTRTLAPATPPAVATGRVPAVAPPAPSPFEPVLDSSGPVRVRRLIVSTAVAGHEPSGATDTIEAGARVYAFVDAANDLDEQVELQVTFEPERGEAVGHVGLRVPASASRWRTWAYSRNVSRPGRWQAVVRDAEGRVIARRAFDVVE